MLKKIGRPSLLVNALSNWAAFGVSVLIGLFLTPFIIGHLGKAGYGIWTLIGSLIGYYGILDLGVTSAITRYVARYAGQKDFKSLNETVSTALALFAVIALAVIGVSFLMGGLLLKFFNVPAEQVVHLRYVVWLLGASTALSFPGYLLGAVVRAHERFVAANIVNMFITILRSGLIVLFLSQGHGLIGVSVSHLLSAIILLILNGLLCRRLFPHFSPNKELVSWRVLRLLLIFGSASTVTMIADQMRFNLDSFVIGKWINLQAVAVFGVAAQLMHYFLQFVSNGTQAVFMPRFAALDGENKADQLRNLFLRSLSISSFLSFGLGTLIILFGKEFIRLWIGSGFSAAVPVLWILTTSYSIALAQNPGVSLVYALKKHYWFAGASLIEGILNLALSIYLAPKYGIVGVAIGTAVPLVIVKIFIQPFYISRIMNIPLAQYWGKILPPFALAGFIILIRSYLPINIGDKAGYVAIGLGGLPIIALFLFSFLGNQIIDKKKEC